MVILVLEENNIYLFSAYLYINNYLKYVIYGIGRLCTITITLK